jgi:hypothetical protein
VTARAPDTGCSDLVQIEFTHRQTADCESGVTAGLLSHHGVRISEALAFGMGSALFFGYFPFLKVGGLPLTTFRNLPGTIIKKVTRRLGIGLVRQRFRTPEKAMDALDQTLASGTPVGLQTGVYWLPYFPPALRFHFNAHNLIVYGRQGDEYLISDPVFDEPVVCPRADLLKARFAKGPFGPQGAMYHVSRVPASLPVRSAVRQGIKEVSRAMTALPVPLIGVRGIRFLARRLEVWPRKLGHRQASRYLGQLIRMQEEIGTGGAGFRFMFAAFLQEAKPVLEEERLAACSQEMTAIGDRWRAFAARAARHCKSRSSVPDDYAQLAEILHECAAREEALYLQLRDLVA